MNVVLVEFKRSQSLSILNLSVQVTVLAYFMPYLFISLISGLS